MKKHNGLVACLLALSAFAFGCGSDGEESISGVIPGEVFVGRTGDVLIIGDGTSWDEGVSVSMGAGITVDSVTVASPTALMVKVTADSLAEVGMRDVAVGDLTFTDAFEVASPIKITSMQGQTAQGSIAIMRIQNLDFVNPFDTTTTGDGFFTPLEYVNIAVTAGEATTAQISSVEPFAMEMLLLTDVNAAAGVVDLEVLSGPADQQLSFRFAAAFEVEAREAEALTSGETVVASVDQPYQSHLYSITASELSIISAGTYAESPDASPSFAMLPASGSFAELMVYGNATTFAGDQTYYMIYWDGSGMSGYSYQIGADVKPALALAEHEPNNGRASSQSPASFPAVIQDASLMHDGDDDVDWIKVVVPQDGKYLHVFTYGDPLTDPALDIYKGTASLLPPTQRPYDADWQEDLTLGPLAAGTYFVQILGSPLYFDPAHDMYSIAVVLE